MPKGKAGSCSLWSPRQILNSSSNKFRLFTASFPNKAWHKQFVTLLLSNTIAPLLPSHPAVHILLPFFPPHSQHFSYLRSVTSQDQNSNIRQGRFYMALSRRNVQAESIAKCLIAVQRNKVPEIQQNTDNSNLLFTPFTTVHVVPCRQREESHYAVTQSTQHQYGYISIQCRETKLSNLLGKPGWEEIKTLLTVSIGKKRMQSTGRKVCNCSPTQVNTANCLSPLELKESMEKAKKLRRLRSHSIHNQPTATSAPHWGHSHQDFPPLSRWENSLLLRDAELPSFGTASL